MTPSYAVGVDEPVLQYRHNPDGSVTGIAPTHCPEGHELGPGRVLVGHDPGVVAHRTYDCVSCMEQGKATVMRYRYPNQ